jgi:protein-L-isoaspartate(D-aspartate) O-methyltransferase
MTDWQITRRFSLSRERRSFSIPATAFMKIAALLIACALAADAIGAGDEWTRARRQMVQQIATLARDLGSDALPRALSAPVMNAMEKVPRHRFVPTGEVGNAYENRPLPIGYGQTISQPYIVALMTELARPEPDAVVLEIGTGSGYQAAILAELGCRVYTIEIIEPLAREAAERLHGTGYPQVTVRSGDGYYGWEEHGPFDAILVTAAASHVPPPLVKQLKPGGRMIVPVGAQFLTQYLTLVEKRHDGTIATRQLLPVRFVPLTGRR